MSDFEATFDRVPKHNRLYIVAAMLVLTLLFGLMLLSLSDGATTRTPLSANVLRADFPENSAR